LDLLSHMVGAVPVEDTFRLQLFGDVMEDEPV